MFAVSRTSAPLGHAKAWQGKSLDRHEAEQRHPHFVCNQCGVVQCLDDVTLVLARGARGPQAIRERTVDVQVKGLCDRCL